MNKYSLIGFRRNNIQGLAWLGKAWQGMAGRGGARQGFIP